MLATPRAVVRGLVVAPQHRRGSRGSRCAKPQRMRRGNATGRHWAVLGAVHEAIQALFNDLVKGAGGRCSQAGAGSDAHQRPPMNGGTRQQEARAGGNHHQRTQSRLAKLSIQL